MRTNLQNFLPVVAEEILIRNKQNMAVD